MKYSILRTDYRKKTINGNWINFEKQLKKFRLQQENISVFVSILKTKHFVEKFISTEKKSENN